MKTKNKSHRKKIFIFAFLAVMVFSLGLVTVQHIHAQGYVPEISPNQSQQSNQVLQQNGVQPSAPIVGPGSASSSSTDVCNGISIFSPKTWINCILVYILRFMGMLLSAAITLFGAIVDVNVFNQVLGQNPVIYQMWAFIRDILNVAFVLALLFSAFCTIFQVEKYSYRALLKTIIIMALLVNFSFPIARVIIDFANVIMYFFIQNLGFTKGNGIWASFADNSALGKIITGTKVTADTSYMIAAIVFIFIFAVTIFMIAILLLIRVIALAILVIFSSIGFVGSIVPFLSDKAREWWNALFKYSFFGPIMIFMVYIALKMMEKIANLQGQFGNIATSQTSESPSFIGALAFFLIPIVILWAGVNAAQNMSIAGASAVVGRGRRFMGNVGRWTYRAPFRGAGWTARQTGIPGGVQQRWTRWKKEGRLFGSNVREEREAFFAGPKEREALQRKKIKEVRDKWKDAGGASDLQIAAALSSRNIYERKAAAMEAVEKAGFNNSLAIFQQARNAVHSDPLLQKIFDDKVKEKHIRFLIEDDISKGAVADVAYKDRLGKLSPEEMAKQKGLHEHIDSNADLQNYILNEVSGDPEYHKEFFKKLSREQRQKYVDTGLHP